jgi:hypothetical protein
VGGHTNVVKKVNQTVTRVIMYNTSLDVAWANKVWSGLHFLGQGAVAVKDVCTCTICRRQKL